MRQFGFYHTSEEKNLLQRVCSWAVDILVVAALAIFLVSLFLNLRTVSGRSMEPALNPGEKVLMSRLSPDLVPYRRLEVVEFAYGENASRTSLKRIIGLPGERVQIMDGKVYINGAELAEGPFQERPVTIAGQAENEIHLGENEYFLMGDNAGSSEDSRFADIGNVKEDQITGRLWLRVSPAEQFGRIR